MLGLPCKTSAPRIHHLFLHVGHGHEVKDVQADAIFEVLIPADKSDAQWAFNR